MQAKVLIVEDSMVSWHILKKILEDENYNVIQSADGKNLVNLIMKEHVDIVLLNIVLPDTNGFDELDILMNTEETKDIPVIIVSSTTSAVQVKRALDAGAVDFIRKPSEPIEIIARVHSALKLKEKHYQLILSSQRDHLTQLYNRRFFHLTFEKHIHHVADYINGIALLLYDCDHFKNVNDVFGHMFGDFVLSNVANAISKSIKQMDYACRFGGEEFSVTLLNVTMLQAAGIAERIRKNIEKMELGLHGQLITVTASCGVSHTYGGTVKSASEMINEADQALYEAKRRGRNQVVVYSDITKKDDEAIS